MYALFCNDLSDVRLVNAPGSRRQTLKVSRFRLTCRYLRPASSAQVLPSAIAGGEVRDSAGWLRLRSMNAHTTLDGLPPSRGDSKPLN
jgi:hypothetical protein